MAKLDVCFETVFTDLPYEDRIRKIAQIGYDGVEFWHPEGTWDGSKIDESMPKDPMVLKQVCKEAGVTICGFVLNAWDGLYGGCPTNADDHKRFIEQTHKTIAFGEKLGCRSVVMLTGLLQKNLSRSQMRANVEKAFGEALALAAKHDFTLQIEPLNIHVDHAGFYLDSVSEGIEIIRGFNSPHMKLLYDMYHMQIMGGNIVATIEKNIDILGHVHVAAVPGRAEPNECELNYPFIFKKADEFGYKGRFGLEYFPKLESTESLKLQLKMVR